MSESPEDVIDVALRVARALESRQWRDILGVLRAQQGNLDDPYLQQWAKHLGLGALLEKARAEAGAQTP